MHRKKIKRLPALLLIFLFLIGSCVNLLTFTVSGMQTEERYISRLVNIVYDDSNSMLYDSRLWWCYAKYSLEVFSSMIQEKDIMNIYYMSDADSSPRISGLSGNRSNQQDNIKKIHNTVTNTGGTPFSSIRRAYNDTIKASGYDEKWLLVITDGNSFSGHETSADLNALFTGRGDVKVVYLAIGDALVPTERATDGVFVYKADGQVSSGSTGILSRVTQICQKIFQRPDIALNQNVLKLDVPVSEIVVFAQGTDVTVGSIPGTRSSSAEVCMTESDKNKATTNPSYIGTVNIAKLNASVITFTPESGNYIDEGTYNLPISADEFIVYYKPCLDVHLNLRNTNGTIMTEKYIPIGSYSIEYWLTYPQGHPKHGEQLTHNPFAVDYTVTCSTNGTVRPLNSTNVDLSEGDVIIKVLAEYLNFSSSDASIKCVVEDFTVNEFDVELIYNQKDYRLSTLEDENDGITVKATVNGTAIPESEWERYTLSLNIDNPDFKTVKNNNSSFTIYPMYNDDDRSSTATGDISFSVTVSASNDHRLTDSGTADGEITIYDDITAVSLGVVISEQGETYDNKNFSSQSTDRKVTIDWQGNNLTQEQYESLDLTVNMNDKYITASIKPDPYVPGQPTTATIHFETVKAEDGSEPPPKRLHGKKEFTVDAVIDCNGQTSSGASKGTLSVDDIRTFGERFHDFIIDWWRLILIIAIIILIFVFWVPLPFLPKRYLPCKCTYHTNSEAEADIYLWKPLIKSTFLVPIKRMWRTIELQDIIMGDQYTNILLKISAVSFNEKKCICRNAGDLGEQGFYIGGIQYFDNNACPEIDLNNLVIDWNGDNTPDNCYVNFIN